MKPYFFTAALLLFSLFSLRSQSFSLNVSSAFGGGVYNEGDTIYIWANPDFNNNVFDGWSGTAVNYMLEPNEWLSRIVVPLGTGISNLTASAQLTDISSSTVFSSENIILPALNGTINTTTAKNVHFRVPQNPKGIIFCFHGTNGSGLGFTNDIEKASFFKSGVLRDYIMVATDANEKTMGDQDGDTMKKWQIFNGSIDSLSNNIDLQVIQALKDTILNRKNLSATFPCFALGVSNGANFADLCAAALGFNASGHITGNGLPAVYNRADSKPVIFIQSENDQHDNAMPAVPVANHNTLLSRNIASELHWHRKTPVYKFRFVRNHFMLVTPAVSDSIFQRMQNTAGLLNSNNIIQVAELSQMPANLFDNLGLSTAVIGDCESQLKVINADHKFHSHYSNRILDFFDQHLIFTTDLNEIEDIENLQIYPNPVSSVLYIESDNPEITVQFFSLDGRLIHEQNKGNTVDVSMFIKGIYFVKINTGDSEQIKKIIKK
jgi:hypothetical protein